MKKIETLADLCDSYNGFVSKLYSRSTSVHYRTVSNRLKKDFGSFLLSEFNRYLWGLIVDEIVKRGSRSEHERVYTLKKTQYIFKYGFNVGVISEGQIRIVYNGRTPNDYVINFKRKAEHLIEKAKQQGDVGNSGAGDGFSRPVAGDSRPVGRVFRPDERVSKRVEGIYRPVIGDDPKPELWESPDDGGSRFGGVDFSKLYKAVIPQNTGPFDVEGLVRYMAEALGSWLIQYAKGEHGVIFKKERENG